MPAPDIQYFLDGSVECCHITGEVYTWGMYFDDAINERVDGLDSRVPRDPHHTKTLEKYGEILEHDFTSWYKDAPKFDSACCSFQGVIGLPRQIKEITLTISSSITEDPPSKIPVMGFKSDHIEDVVDYFSLAEFFDKAHRTATRWKMNRVYDPRSVMNHLDGLYRHGVERLLSNQSKQEIKNRRKQEKKILARSVQTALNIMPSSDVKMFLSGEEVRITGNKHIYSITKRSNLSHGGAELKILDMEGAYLNHLCIYTPDVPLLDHLLSIYVHIKSGMEDEILNIGNSYTIKDGGQGDLIQGLLEDEAEVPNSLVLWSVEREKARKKAIKFLEKTFRISELLKPAKMYNQLNLS